MIGHAIRRPAARALAIAAALGCGDACARDGRSERSIVALPLRLSMEWTELFHPGKASRLVNEGFALSGGAKNFRLQYSNRAPAALGGTQFQWLPAGYRLVEFGASGTWGSFSAFRSAGYSARSVQPAWARAMTGAGIELPRPFLGFRLRGNAVHSSPDKGAGDLRLGLRPREEASQIDLTLGREWKRGARLRMEWSRSGLVSRAPGEGGAVGRIARSGDAWLVKFEGAPLRSEMAIVVMDRDGGFANALFPSLTPGGGHLRIDLARKVGGQRFMYGGRSDWQSSQHIVGAVTLRAREETIGWSWSRGRLPRIETSYYWNRRAAAGMREGEGGWRLSLGRAFGKLRATALLVRARHSDLLSQRTLWDRRALSGEVTFEMREGRRASVRYEAGDLFRVGAPVGLRVHTLKADGALDAWEKRLSLVPVVELAAPRGGWVPAALRAALAARIIPPPWFPGTDWVIRFATHRTASAGQSARTHTDLTFRWSFRR